MLISWNVLSASAVTDGRCEKSVCLPSRFTDLFIFGLSSLLLVVSVAVETVSALTAIDSSSGVTAAPFPLTVVSISIAEADGRRPMLRFQQATPRRL